MVENSGNGLFEEAYTRRTLSIVEACREALKVQTGVDLNEKILRAVRSLSLGCLYFSR